MAKKKTNGTDTANRRDDFEAPEGFDINIEREKGQGWISKEEGNTVVAKILSRHEYKNKRGKTRAFYQLELIKPAKCQIPNPNYNDEADEDDGNPAMLVETLKEGAIVNVDEFKKLEDLRSYAKDGGIYNVWFVIKGKVELSDGNSMWEIAGPKLQVVKKPDGESFGSRTGF